MHNSLLGIAAAGVTLGAALGIGAWMPSSSTTVSALATTTTTTAPTPPVPVAPTSTTARPTTTVPPSTTSTTAKPRATTTTAASKSTDLVIGSTGDAVADLERRLTELGYWLGKADRRYDGLTAQAVMAFQKASGRARTGRADAGTVAALKTAARPKARSAQGDLVEIDKARQLLFIVRGGKVRWTLNTSTGTEKPYKHGSETLMADTPPGRWTVTWAVDGRRDGALGELYRPRYFHKDGIAIHGSPSVPGHPASHGCARVSNGAIDWIWANDLVPIGSTVWIY